MSYTVYFKSPSLKQIFSHAADRYADDCTAEVGKLLAQETPGETVGRIYNRAQANSGGDLTPALESKLKALPFVKKVKTDVRRQVPFTLYVCTLPARWVQAVVYNRIYGR